MIGIIQVEVDHLIARGHPAICSLQLMALTLPNSLVSSSYQVTPPRRDQTLRGTYVLRTTRESADGGLSTVPGRLLFLD